MLGTGKGLDIIKNDNRIPKLQSLRRALRDYSHYYVLDSHIVITHTCGRLPMI